MGKKREKPKGEKVKLPKDVAQEESQSEDDGNQRSRINAGLVRHSWVQTSHPGNQTEVFLPYTGTSMNIISGKSLSF